MIKTKREYLSYIHFMRGVAILYVVSVHARGFASYWHSSPEMYSFLDSFSDPSEGNGTTLFLFIGGFLFQHLTHERFVYRKYLLQKFKVLILPYLVISAPLIFLRLNTDFQSLSLPDDFYQRSVFEQVIHFLATGSHLPPFWFISTIILFYISSPLLHALDNERFYRMVFPLILLASLFTYRPEHNANPFLSYLHFIPVFMTGMFASYYKNKILKDDNVLLFILLGVYLAVCAGELTGLITLSRDTSFEDVLYGGVTAFNIYMFKALVLCFLWMVFFYRIRNARLPTLELFANYSFGLFFVHYLFISVSRKLFERNGLTFDFSAMTYLLYFAAILLVSVGAVYVVKRFTGGYSRYLIGS